MNSEIAALAHMTTDDLWGELRHALTLTTRYLVYLAAVWRELENRGQDLSQLRDGIMGSYVAAIASGSLLPETVIAFAEQPKLLQRAAALPVEQQRVVIENPQQLQTPVRRRIDHGRPSNPQPVVSANPDAPAGNTLPALLKMFAVCSVGDAHEMILQLINGTSDPIAVSQRLLPELEKLTKKKRRAWEGSHQ